jgi:hypothetical protein
MELGRFGLDPDAPEPETLEELIAMLLALAAEGQDAKIVPFPEVKHESDL